MYKIIEYYTIQEIIQKIIDEYNLENSPSLRDSLRKKIISICKELRTGTDDKNIWEKSKILKENRKKPSHRFTASDKNTILTSPVLAQYLYDKFPRNHKIKKLLEYTIKANKLNEADYEYFTSGAYEEDLKYIEERKCPDPISDKDVYQKKKDIMLEALFLKFFTPIDTDKLRKDMEIVALTEPMENTIETVQAQERLDNPSCYYKNKK